MHMTMKQVQNLLQYLGYYDGIPDDEYDPKTRDATFDFQVAYGTIGVDGIPGPEVEAALIDAVATGKYFKTAPQKPQKAPDGWDGIKYFRREEFRCKCGKYCNGFPVEPDLGMVRIADAIRERLGVPLHVNSGIRCKTHNSAVGGAKSSQHMYGTACDLGKPNGVTPARMAEIAEDIMGNTGGIGIYSWGIHIDNRKTKSRWNG